MPGLDEAWARLRSHQAAVAADPSSASDWCAIATLVTAPPLLISGGGRLTGGVAGPYAREAAERALALDPGLAEAHRVMGWLQHFRDWDLSAAEASFRTALDLQPTGATADRARAQLALLLVQTDRDDEAVRTAEPIAMERLRGVALGQVAYLRRRFDEAERHTRPSPFWHGLSLCAVGEPRRAADELEAGADGDDRNPGYVALMAYAYALAGDGDSVDRLEAELRERGRTERLVDYQLATVAVAKGDLDLGFTLLERSIDVGANWPLWLRRDLRFDPLRADPRLEPLLARIPGGAPSAPGR